MHITVIYKNRRYGVSNFLFDVLMCCILGPIWLVWIYIREKRNR